MKRSFAFQVGFWVCVALACVLVLVFAARGRLVFAAPFGKEELVLDRSVPGEQLSEVVLSLFSEQVDIFPSEGSEVRVVQYGKHLKPEQILQVEMQGNAVNISRPRGSWRSFSFFFFSPSPHSSRVELYLPAEYSGALRVNLSSGSVTIQRELALSDLSLEITSGQIRSEYPLAADHTNVRISSGSLRLLSLHTAEMAVTLTSGSISVETLQADHARLQVSSGRIHVGNMSGSGDMQVTSGQIRIDAMQLTESLQLQTSSGSIALGLAGNPSLQFDGKTTSGTLSTYFDVWRNETAGKSLTATVGTAPYKTLQAYVTSGSIRIFEAEVPAVSGTGRSE